MRQIELLVLAGGFGTRLREAVPDVPKPLAPVCGEPYLHYLLQSWIGQGVTSLTFLLHHQAGSIMAFLETRQSAGQLHDCQVRSVTEPEPLGTGGAIAHAVRRLRIQGPFLVANADTWLGSGIECMCAAPSAAMGVVHVADTSRYGNVHLENDRVIAFLEKRSGNAPGWINAGLYRLDSGLFEDWNERPFSLERELLPRLAGAGQLHAAPLQTDFIDIGVPADYFRFCRWIGSGKAGLL